MALILLASPPIGFIINSPAGICVSWLFEYSFYLIAKIAKNGNTHISVIVKHQSFVGVKAMGLDFDGGMSDAETGGGVPDVGYHAVEVCDIVYDYMDSEGIFSSGECPDV